jgi:energy-coupling factor transporter ATP-binding protein EcfA2
MFVTNYRLFYEFLFEEKIPVAVVVTNLEREDCMDDWYTRNKGWFERHAVKCIGHACITAADDLDPTYREKYDMSRAEVGCLIRRHAHGAENGGDAWLARFTGGLKDLLTGRPNKSDVLGVLTKRCGMEESLAKDVIRILSPRSTAQTQTIRPKTAESTTRTIRPKTAESATQIIPPTMAASGTERNMSPSTSGPQLQLVKYHNSPKRHRTIVLFGEAGAGKSSLINLMAGEELAPTSSDMQRCTTQWKEYAISFGGDSYKVFDTVGLEEPQLGIKEYLESVENSYRLIKELDRQGGIDLLLFCIRPGNIITAIQRNYRLFHEFLCEKKSPVVLAITSLERERRMEDWWERNKRTFGKYQIQVAGHACITAANKLGSRHKDLYEESRITIRQLAKKFTTDEQKQAWIGGDNLFASLMRKPKELLAGNSHMKRKDLVPLLVERCGMSQDVARQLANMITGRVDL